MILGVAILSTILIPEGHTQEKSLSALHGSERSLLRRASCRKGSRSKRRVRGCRDADRDGLRTRVERKKYHTDPRDFDTDDDALSDGEEVKKYHTDPLNPDTDNDGLLDGEEPTFGTDPLNPDTDGDGILDGDEDNDGNGRPDGENNSTNTSQVCDEEGNTSGFGIPSGESGNVFVGEAVYSQRCIVCHAGVVQGEGLVYGDLEQAIARPPMFIALDTQTLSDLVAYVNALNCEPVGGTPGTTPTPTPTPSPSGSPTPTPTPDEGCFDSNGNTTDFGIPAGLVGNVSEGQAVYISNCNGCHAGIKKGEGRDYGQIVTALALPVMNISLPAADLADLVAYLNTNHCPTGGPTPTPTPSDPIERGRLEYLGTCSSCHSNPNQFRSLTVHQLDEAIRDKPQMRGITYTMDLFAYFWSLPGGGGGHDD